MAALAARSSRSLCRRLRPDARRSFEKNAGESHHRPVVRSLAKEASLRLRPRQCSRRPFGGERRETNGRSVSEPPGGTGKDLRIRTDRQTEPDAGASAGDRARRKPILDRGPKGNDTGCQAPFFGEDHVPVRVGSTFGSAPFALAPSPLAFACFRRHTASPQPTATRLCSRHRRMGAERRRDIAAPANVVNVPTLHDERW